ncbi:MAG: outer membrane beta-barrel protein, partial [Flavobacteriales bacterium]
MCMARVDITTDRSDPSLASYTGMCASLRSLGIAAVGPLLLSCALQAQDSSAVRISGYAEVDDSYDLARPENGERPDFLYNHKRHNEVNLNLGLLRAEYLKDGVRAGLGLMAGTYAQYNLAAEPELLRSVYEARIGIRLSRSRDLWVD